MSRKTSRVLCLPRGHVVGVLPGETLLAAARRLDVPLASSCGGRAVCGDCVVHVISGAGHLSAPDADELAWRARTGRGGDAARLACCLRVTGPAEVSTTYW